MKLNCCRQQLNDCLTLLTNNFSTNNEPKIFNYVLLEAESDMLALTVYDGERSVYLSTEAQVTQTGAVALPLEKLKQLICNLTESTVNLTLVSPTSIKIHTKSTEIELEIVSQAEFISPVIYTQGVLFTLKTETLFKGIESSIFACGNAKDKQILSGLNIQIMPTTIDFWGTNSVRLAHSKWENSTEIETTLTVSAKTLKIVKQIMDLAKKEQIKISYSPQDKFVKFEIDKFTITDNICLDNYPQCASLIPGLFKTQIILNRKELLDNLQLLKPIAKNKIVRLILNLEQQNIALIATTPQLAKGEQTQAAEIIGLVNEQEGVCLNINYLSEAINQLNSKKIKILLNNYSEPCLIQGLEAHKSEHLIMPIQVR